MAEGKSRDEAIKRAMDAREAWEEEGRLEGAEYILIEQISKKMKKGKRLEIIVQELETDVEKVQYICKSAEAFAPDYDPQAIFKARHNPGTQKSS